MVVNNTVAPHKQVVPAPPANPPRYSLLQVADPISFGTPEGVEDPRPVRWQGGVEWTPEAKNQGDVMSVGCVGNTDALRDDFTLDGLTAADPFMVYAEDRCSTFGWAAHDYEGRANRQLLAIQSARVAAELERGALAQADSNTNRWLTDAPDIVGVPGGQSPNAALGDIEMGLAEHFGGRRCMIHASPALLTALHVGNVLTMSGNKWTTPMGNIVVADAGYLGTRPDADNSSTKQWLYGTLPVEYVLSAIEILPGTLDQARAQATDLRTNLTRVYAQRLALLMWDEGVVAAETDIPAYS